MASSSALVFGQHLVESLLPTTLAAGSSLVISPLSVWFALLLVLSGAGNVTHASWLSLACMASAGQHRTWTASFKWLCPKLQVLLL